MYYTPASNHMFLLALGAAQEAHAHIAAATTRAGDLHLDPHDPAYLAPDSLSGFVVRTSGELVGVFSTVKGRGDHIVASATRRGATHLDCFDGYLPKLYARHGFQVTRYEANYNGAHLPGVVYMSRLGGVPVAQSPSETHLWQVEAACPQGGRGW